MNDEIDLLMPLPTGTDPAPAQPPDAMEEEWVFEAKRRITLRCGKSSITLYPNGKIVLRGEYILSDAEGINRIAGGQVELN
ncbi:hypothetical protein [Burkholderia sp. F1]|uniref:hypothetical protein n=1 Tax=Burkholderia sp. F1 TaxID=3366817 RepID=UPI003D75F7E0